VADELLDHQAALVSTTIHNQEGTMTETQRRSVLTGHTHLPQAEDFESLYLQGVPPWDIGRPQPPFAELAERGVLAGRVLDAGCGTGEHALMAAARGLEVTGFDVAATVIAIANTKARDRGLTARFLELNALDLSSLGEQFDTVLDCGLFHVFGDDDRPRFVRELRASMTVGGHYYMLCMSDRQGGDWGPHRIRAEEIRDSFVEGWTVDSIGAAKIDITIDPHQAEAWLAVITCR
jgi:2-polyprenyl-3-methyl-5-hydroxy-6-metoxy-1,4-benzoquinol methylase